MLAEDLAQQRGVPSPEIFMWSARLAHSVYSFAYADKRYAQVLQWRPKLPDAVAGRAAIVYQATHKLDDVEKLLTESLAINPHHVDSHLLWAKVALEEERYDDAKKHLDTALEVNPNHMLGLAMLALYHVETSHPEEYAKIEARMKEIKPICPDFYCDVAEMMENKRGFNTAAPYYKKAIEIAPEYWRGYYGLGMNTSRIGAAGEDSGKALLLKAFGKNKFNVWALNMIKMLDRLIGDKEQDVAPVYSESKTKHFTLKFFGKEADIVRPYLEEWAEAAYESQSKKFHYEPEGPLSI
jgi:tetratricopeptide (TPR) repeat protein